MERYWYREVKYESRGRFSFACNLPDRKLLSLLVLDGKNAYVDYNLLVLCSTRDLTHSGYITR